MSRCKSCGEQVAWARKPSGVGWHRPLERVQDPTLFTIKDEIIQPLAVPIFRIHVCSDENVEAYGRQIAEYNATHVEGSSHTLLDVTVVCPRCSAEVGERCRPLNPEQYRKANKFNGDHLVTPHKERVALTQGGSDA